MSSALLLGASGLIGQQLLPLLLKDYQRLNVLVRKPLSEPLPEQTGLEVTVSDFEQVLKQPDLYSDLFEVDDVFCCLGTTIKTVGGDKEAFKRVDYHYPVELAKLAHSHGAQRIFVVSSLSASPAAKAFYSQVKGLMQRDITELAYVETHFFQPSLLLGDRDHLDQPKRSAEHVGQTLMPLLNPLLQGGLRKYRPTRSSDVAQRMAEQARQQLPGCHIHVFK